MKLFYLIALVPAVFAAPVILVRNDPDIIPGKWIVKLKSDADSSALTSTIASVTSILGTSPRFTYNFGSFRGFAIDAAKGIPAAVQALASIEAIEPDGKVRANAIVTQQNPPYGLARISSRAAGTTEYRYDESAGDGTFAYIIDTVTSIRFFPSPLSTNTVQGIFAAHNDFGGRAVFAANFAEDGEDFDGNGHGTHVAGTTGSHTYGVAKKTSLIGVKVLDAEGSGALSQVIAGIDYAVNDMKTKGRTGKSVANLSLGGIISPMTNQAVAQAADEGLFMAVAAGNNGLPTITASPASEPKACTVGATDIDDNRAYFSNFGLLVDIFAPGVNVESTWNNGSDETNTISGTSMATPHITGLGAYLLALEGARTPDALCRRMQDLSTKDAIFLPLSKNYLAYNGLA